LEAGILGKSIDFGKLLLEIKYSQSLFYIPTAENLQFMAYTIQRPLPDFSAASLV